MGFKKINVGGIENLVEFELGQPIEGIFTGKTIHTAKDGEIHNMGKLIIDEKEHLFFLGGQLAFLMGQVPEKSLVRITYQGLTPKEVQCKKGGKRKLHQYKVEIDDGK